MKKTISTCNLSTVLSLAAFAVAAGFASAAYADNYDTDLPPFVSSKTRAEVQAELAQFKKDGINPWSSAYNPLKYFKSTKTRAEVTAEYMANRDLYDAMNGDDGGAAYRLQHPGVK